MEVRLSLAERTLNRIWNADRKKGQTFWGTMTSQFAIMEEALEEARDQVSAALREETRARLAAEAESALLREALTDILLLAEDGWGQPAYDIAQKALEALMVKP